MYGESALTSPSAARYRTTFPPVDGLAAIATLDAVAGQAHHSTAKTEPTTAASTQHSGDTRRDHESWPLLGSTPRPPRPTSLVESIAALRALVNRRLTT